MRVGAILPEGVDKIAGHEKPSREISTHTNRLAPTWMGKALTEKHPHGTAGTVVPAAGPCVSFVAYALPVDPRLSMWLSTTAWISSMPGIDGFLGSKHDGFSAMCPMKPRMKAWRSSVA